MYVHIVMYVCSYLRLYETDFIFVWVIFDWNLELFLSDNHDTIGLDLLSIPKIWWQALNCTYFPDWPNPGSQFQRQAIHTSLRIDGIGPEIIWWDESKDTHRSRSWGNSFFFSDELPHNLQEYSLCRQRKLWSKYQCFYGKQLSSRSTYMLYTHWWTHTSPASGCRLHCSPSILITA